MQYMSTYIHRDILRDLYACVYVYTCSDVHLQVKYTCTYTWRDIWGWMWFRVAGLDSGAEAKG